jgi:ABC-2 type transport system permease protein
MPLRKYWNIFRVSLIERMTYRLDFLLSTFLRFLPLLTSVLLWAAVYAGADQAPLTESGEREINGFTLRQLIAYLLLVNVSRIFSSMPGLAGGIARDIRDGDLKKYLLQPIDMIAYLAAYRLAHKVAYVVGSFVPYAVLFFAFGSYFDGLPDPATLAAYAASLMLAFVMGFFFEACIGMTGFWFLEVTSFLYVVNTVNFFLSGHMFPLDLLPPFWAGLLKALPFQYLAYFPAAVFLGKVQGWELARGLLAELGWAVFFVVLARGLYHRGLRRYSAYGG